jgi:hypothetical protein
MAVRVLVSVVVVLGLLPQQQTVGTERLILVLSMGAAEEVPAPQLGLEELEEADPVAHR